MIIGAFAFTLVGCACTQKFPSVTLGGAANKEATLDASLNKSGLSVTVPLVNLDVPFPSVETGGDEE